MVDSKEFPGIPQATVDAAKFMADAVNLHVSVIRAFDRDKPGFVAIKLSDGKSPDGILYDSRAEATRHNMDHKGLMFVQVKRDTMPLREAIMVLQMHRRAYARGVVFTEEEIVVPHLPELSKLYLPNTVGRLFPNVN